MSRMNKKMLMKAYEEAFAVKDKEIKAQNTLRVDFYRKELWRIFLGSVAVKVPEHWSIDYFRTNLLHGGSIGITKLDGVVIPYAYNVLSRNAWHYPVKTRGRDLVPVGERTVGKDCEIIYLESAGYYSSLYNLDICSLIDIYAEKLACCDGSIDINLLVSRTPWLFEVENEQQANDMKALVTRIMSGVPAAYYKRKREGQKSPLPSPELPMQRLPVKENFIANDVQLTKHEIMCEFLSAIGVNNANTDKRERLIKDEVNANNQQLKAAVNLWQDHVNRQIERVKKLYGNELDGELSVTFGLGVEDAESYRFNGDLPDRQRERELS